MRLRCHRTLETKVLVRYIADFINDMLYHRYEDIKFENGANCTSKRAQSWSAQHKTGQISLALSKWYWSTGH